MDPCDHIQHHDMAACPGLTPEEEARGEKIRSVSLNFVGTNGKTNWHDGPTNREYLSEMYAGAKAAGNEPPQKKDVSWT